MTPSLLSDNDVAQFHEDLRRVANEFGKFPGDERAYNYTDWKKRGNHDGENRLTFDEETDWISDLSFLAAVSARNVSAVIVEERLDERTLKSYAAANVGILDQVEAMVQSVVNTLTECAQMLISCRECADKILNIVVPIQASRIHDRLQSLQLIPPKSQRGRLRSACTPTLLELIEKTVFQNVRDGASEEIERLKTSVRQLGDLYSQIPSRRTSILEEGETNLLKKIIKKANKVTSVLGARTLEKALEERRPQAAHGDVLGRLARQVDKLARYWSACKSLSCFAWSKRSIFQQFTIEALPPYSRNNKKRIVHAEIQLLVYASLNPLQSRPRSIGVSKVACYLCDIFISNHGKYFIPGTHGTLFGKWRFPYLNELRPEPDNDTINEFRKAFQSMRLELNRLLKTQSPSSMKPRPSPMQSRVFYSRRSPATFSSGSLSRIMPSDHERVGAPPIKTKSRESVRRQDSGYQTGPAEPSPSIPSPLTKQDDAVIPEEANGTTELSGEPTEGPVMGEELQMRDPVLSTNSSQTSLGSIPSTIRFTSSTITESSYVISKRTPARFAINSLCLDVTMKDHDVRDHETTARVMHLRGTQEIAARLRDDSQMAVIDRRNLLRGEECIIPIPETDTGRGISFILGKSPTFDEAMYLELKVSNKTGTLA